VCVCVVCVCVVSVCVWHGVCVCVCVLATVLRLLNKIIVHQLVAQILCLLIIASTCFGLIYSPSSGRSRVISTCADVCPLIC